jgi:hypothetical protein
MTVNEPGYIPMEQLKRSVPVCKGVNSMMFSPGLKYFDRENAGKLMLAAQEFGSVAFTIHRTGTPRFTTKAFGS